MHFEGVLGLILSLAILTCFLHHLGSHDIPSPALHPHRLHHNFVMKSFIGRVNAKLFEADNLKCFESIYIEQRNHPMIFLILDKMKQKMIKCAVCQTFRPKKDVNKAL